MKKDTPIGVDCGYSDGVTIKFAEDNNINLYVPSRAQAQEFFRERLRMKEKMQTVEARKIYGMRKITVEPVYGNIKQNMGFREFLTRGLKNVKNEFNLACIAHNLLKIHRFGTRYCC